MTTAPSLALLRDTYDDEDDEVTTVLSPEPLLIARSRMQSLTIHPPAPESVAPPPPTDLFAMVESTAPAAPATSLPPPPRYSMRVPKGTAYSQVAARSENAPRPTSLAPAPLPEEQDDLGFLQLSALRLILDLLTESAGPAARPMMLVEIQALGATAETFPRLLAGSLITRLSERLDVTETRRRFIANGCAILDKEMYVQVPRG